MKRLLSAALILLCGVIVFGCSNNNKSNTDIKPETGYYLTAITPYAFPHKMKKNDDHSFLEFDSEFKTMSIHFDKIPEGETGGEFIRIDFIISSFTQKNGQINGTASRIESEDGPDKGKIIRYSFWSDYKKIYLKTLVSYLVKASTDPMDLGTYTINLNVIVAQFARTAPGYIGGST